MNDGTRPETSAAGSITSRSRLARLTSRMFAALARNWHDTVYLERRLLDAQRPWDQQGPLRWQRELGGWRVVGAYLADDGRTASRTS
jgi:hypothetical protein